MAGLTGIVYRAIFKRSPTLLLAAIIGGVALERGIDIAGEEIFHQLNKGLLWDDIKHNYAK